MDQPWARYCTGLTHKCKEELVVLHMTSFLLTECVLEVYKHCNWLVNTCLWHFVHVKFLRVVISEMESRKRTREQGKYRAMLRYGKMPSLKLYEVKHHPCILWQGSALIN